MAGATAGLVDFILDAKFTDLPDSVVRVTKQILLDDIGCALGAYVTDKARIGIDFVREFGAEGVATIIGGGKTAASLAAFVNGELINALDYDIIGPCIGHVTPFVTPSCLVAAEQAHASGRDLILATALAHEVGGRVGGSLSQMKIPINRPPYFEDAPRFSHGVSIFGGVAGSGKLLNLNEKEILNAMGIAGWSAPMPAGMKFEHLETPLVMTKYCWAGWVAQLATTAVLMAQRGFTGDTSILDGQWGFWQMYGSPFFNEAALLGGLGESWRLVEAEFKPYPVCRCNHSAIDVIIDLVRENHINVDSISRLTVMGDPFLLTPNRSGLNVQSPVDTQFNNAYVFAAACCYGQNAGPLWQLPKTINDPRIRTIMPKIEVKVHPNHESLIIERLKKGEKPTFREVIVEIVAGGKTYTGNKSSARGSRETPLSDNELVHKFKDNAEYSPMAGQHQRIDRIIEMLSTLEEIEDIAPLFQLLSR